MSRTKWTTVTGKMTQTAITDRMKGQGRGMERDRAESDGFERMREAEGNDLSGQEDTGQVPWWHDATQREVR